jgi:hypothetical protein
VPMCRINGWYRDALWIPVAITRDVLAAGLRLLRTGEADAGAVQAVEWTGEVSAGNVWLEGCQARREWCAATVSPASAGPRLDVSE